MKEVLLTLIVAMNPFPTFGMDEKNNTKTEDSKKMTVAFLLNTIPSTNTPYPYPLATKFINKPRPAHGSTINNKIFCLHCSQDFCTRKEQLHHYRKEHLKEQRCNHCDKMVTRFDVHNPHEHTDLLYSLEKNGYYMNMSQNIPPLHDIEALNRQRIKAKKFYECMKCKKLWRTWAVLLFHQMKDCKDSNTLPKILYTPQ